MVLRDQHVTICPVKEDCGPFFYSRVRDANLIQRVFRLAKASTDASCLKTLQATGDILLGEGLRRPAQCQKIVTHLGPDLVPKILLDVLTNHITSNKVF